MTNEELFDAGNFDALYRQNRGLMIERIHAMPRHLQDEGIANEAFVQAIAAYRPSSGNKFSTFLTHVLMNCIRMVLRAESNRTKNMQGYKEAHGENDFNRREVEEAVDEQEESNKTKQHLRALLGENGALPENERQILTLRYGIGGEEPLTLEQVSVRLRIPRSTVAVMENRAKATLRRALEKTA